VLPSGVGYSPALFSLLAPLLYVHNTRRALERVATGRFGPWVTMFLITTIVIFFVYVFFSGILLSSWIGVVFFLDGWMNAWKHVEWASFLDLFVCLLVLNHTPQAIFLKQRCLIILTINWPFSISLFFVQ
jgi:hypothetical protein